MGLTDGIDRSADKEKDDITNETLIKLYIEARNDYRNSLNMEQTILNFGVAILALCTATGFTLYHELQSWIIFSLIVPFFLSLVKFLYLHQKHRSKSYKIYQKYIEEQLSNRIKDFPAFENWKSNSVTSFVKKRRGFYFAYLGICVVVPYLFIVIGFYSYSNISYPLLYIFYGMLFIVLVGDFICVNYVLSIKKILNK